MDDDPETALDLTDEVDDGYFELTEEEWLDPERGRVHRLKLVSNRIRPGEYATLVRALRDKTGDLFDEDDLDDLERAIEEDDGVGERTHSWLGRMAEKVITRTVVGVTVDVVTRLVLRYAGML